MAIALSKRVAPVVKLAAPKKGQASKRTREQAASDLRQTDYPVSILC
jgi:hypothetical protein